MSVPASCFWMRWIHRFTCDEMSRQRISFVAGLNLRLSTDSDGCSNRQRCKRAICSKRSAVAPGRAKSTNELFENCLAWNCESCLTNPRNRFLGQKNNYASVSMIVKIKGWNSAIHQGNRMVCRSPQKVVPCKPIRSQRLVAVAENYPWVVHTGIEIRNPALRSTASYPLCHRGLA